MKLPSLILHASFIFIAQWRGNCILSKDELMHSYVRKTVWTEKSKSANSSTFIAKSRIENA